MRKILDDYISEGNLTGALRHIAKEYYANGKMGHTYMLTVKRGADEIDRLTKLCEKKAKNKAKKLVYVCSPLRGDFESNITKARQYCREIALAGDIPIASHVYGPQFLNDNIPEERAAGMRIGIELLRFCDEVRVYGSTISEGMAAEIKEAERLGLPVRYEMQP